MAGPRAPFLLAPQGFWVRLLSYIMETDALTPICASLTNLAERQLHAEDEEANASKSRLPSPGSSPEPREPGLAEDAAIAKITGVDLPVPEKLLARLLGEGRGIAMLNLLKTLSQSIAPSMADMWELEIPLLVKYLEEHTEFTWNQETWEDKLIQFLRNSLKKTRGSNWSLRLSKELNNQIESFDSPSLEKGFLYRALGFTLATGLEADKVEVLLLELLYKTDYSNDFDREGVILCFGLCARGQVKTVLGVLHDFEERIQESEQSWQIGAWRKDHPWRRETVKGALMVMYSCVASYCHPQMLLIHVDNPITTKIIHHYSSSCQACMATIFQCVPFWGWKALESSVDHGDATAPKEMTGFQMTLCSVLTQKKPAVLYNFLLETMTYVKSNLSRIRIAACNLAGIIMKQMSAHYLRKLDFPALRNSLQELQLDSDPGVWRAALETPNILDTCSQQQLLASPEGIS